MAREVVLGLAGGNFNILTIRRRMKVSATSHATAASNQNYERNEHKNEIYVADSYNHRIQVFSFIGKQ